MLTIIQPALTEKNVKNFLALAGFEPSHRIHLSFWLRPGSVYHHYSRSCILLARSGFEILGGIVVSLNPRIQHDRTVANFYSLWFKAGLNDDLKLLVSDRLLREAENTARKWRAQTLIGPLVCSTWHNQYRVLYETAPLSDSIPVFPGEAVEKMDCRQHYEQAGYRLDQLYMSTVVPPGSGYPGDEFGRNGRYEVKSLEGSEILAAGDHLFPMLRRVFRNSYLFADIGVDEFMALQKFQHGPLTRQRLYLVLPKKSREVAAFLWCYCYGYGAKVFHVMKTMGTAPEFRGRRLGQRLLSYGTNQIRVGEGDQIIYALMRKGGSSSNISGRHKGEIFRTYALYGKQI